MKNKKKTYKKYPNRRIYDNDASKYVTLPEIAETIRQGYQVEIMDAKRQEDVTALILTQIVMELAKNKRSIIPVRLLHLFIQAGETVMHDFFDKYFEKALENFLSYRSQMEEQFKLYMDFSAKTTNMMNQMNPFRLTDETNETKQVE